MIALEITYNTQNRLPILRQQAVPQRTACCLLIVVIVPCRQWLWEPARVAKFSVRDFGSGHLGCAAPDWYALKFL